MEKNPALSGSSKIMPSIQFFLIFIFGIRILKITKKIRIYLDFDLALFGFCSPDVSGQESREEPEVHPEIQRFFLQCGYLGVFYL